MKKPDCLTFENKALPMEGWCRSMDSKWEECWLISIDRNCPSPYLCVMEDRSPTFIQQFTTTDPNSMKLTAEYMADKWEKWAKWAAVDSNGSPFQYASSEQEHTGIAWLTSNDMSKKIPGKFDATDWKNSVIERPMRNMGTM